MATPNLLGLSNGTPAILASTQLASGDNTIYTVATGKAVKVLKLVLCNTTSSAVTVSVSIVPSGGTVDGTHKIVSAYSLQANDSTTITEIADVQLPEGAYISINVATAAAVDVFANGLVLN